MAKTAKKETTEHPHPHTHRHAEGEEEMCCDGSGRTAEEHRKESADGKCCIDD